jgi:hypothetical protein
MKVSFEVDGYTIKVLEGPYVQHGKPTSAARDFAARLITMLDRMRAFAAGKFVTKYNEIWREEGDPVLSEQDICSRLVNPKIVLYDEDGAAIVYFGDSDMFGGHAIEVSIDGGEISHASMVG